MKEYSENVFFHGFYLQNTKIIETIADRNDWFPSVINTFQPQIKTEGIFKESLIFENFKIRNGKFPNIKQQKHPIDQISYDKLSKYLINYLDLLQDTTGWNFSLEERKEYFLKAFNFWYSILVNRDISLFVSLANPHTPTCYLIYLICKEVLNIKVLFFDAAPLFNNRMHLVRTTYSSDINEYIKRNIDSNLFPKEKKNSDLEFINNYLGSIKNANSPSHIIREEPKEKEAKKYKYFDIFKIIVRSFIPSLKYTDQIFYKKNRKNFYTDSSKLNIYEYYKFTKKIRKNNIILKKYYNSKIKTPDLKNKFIYFPSSYQPESRTKTTCGIFDDQINALNLIRKYLPDDYYIYFKEHKSIFFESETAKGSLARSKEYYDKLLNIKNLIFVNEEYDTFKLIKNCQAVATVGGTAGFEAAVYEKPSIIFGDPWYNICRCFLKVKTDLDCKLSIAKILENYKPNYNELVEDMYVLLKNSYDIDIRDLFAEEPKLIQNNKISDAFFNEYKKNYK